MQVMLRSLGQSLLINGMIGLFLPQIDNWYVGGRPGNAGAMQDFSCCCVGLAARHSGEQRVPTTDVLRVSGRGHMGGLVGGAVVSFLLGPRYVSPPCTAPTHRLCKSSVGTPPS